MSSSHLKSIKKPPESSEEQKQKLSSILEEEESNVSPEPEDSSGGGEHKVVHVSSVEQEQKLSPILEEEESNLSPESEDSNGGGKHKVVHMSGVEQESKLSPILEEDESNVSPEPDGGSSEEQEGSKFPSKPVETSLVLARKTMELSKANFEMAQATSNIFNQITFEDTSLQSRPGVEMEVLNPEDSSGEPMEVLKQEVSTAKQSLVGDANPNLPITNKAAGYDMNFYSNIRAIIANNLVLARKTMEQSDANFEVAQATSNIYNQITLEDTALRSRPGVEMEEMNTRTLIGSGERSSSRSIESNSSAKPPKSDHVCGETCIHGGAKPKTRSLARSTVNMDVESPNPQDESEIILDSVVTLMKGMVKKASQNPARNINREEWEEKLKNASFVTEELGRPLGYRPVIQMPDDNSSSPYLVVHRQLNRMLLSLSLNDDGKSETQPCIVTRCASDLAVEASSNLQEHSITSQEKDSISESEDVEKVSNDNDVESEDITTILLKWKISTEESEPVLVEEQDHMHQEEIFCKEAEHKDEEMEVPEEQVLEHEEDDDAKDQTRRTEDAAIDPQPEQQYRLMRLAPILPPVNQIGPVNPNHPYRERKLDRWRAAMMTAYRSERYHTTDLLDHTMSQLEAEGISRDDFYRLYHSTRLIDYYRDDGVHEARTFSELSDMDLEDRINQIIIAVGYMTVAMLYMRLQAERNPEVTVVSEDSSESSAFDSGNMDSLESDPTVQYAPLKEHVNIDLAESPEGVQSTSSRKLSSSSCSTTSTDIYFDPDYQSIINSDEDLDSTQSIQPPGNRDSPQGIQSPGNTEQDVCSPNIIAPLNSSESDLTKSSGSDSPQGIQSSINADSLQGIRSPDIIAPPSSVESSLNDPQSVLVPLREVAKQCQTSSSQQSLLNMSSDTSDGNSSSPQTPHSVEDDPKREAVLKSSWGSLGGNVSLDPTPTPSEEQSKTDPKANKSDKLHKRNVGELMNICVDVLFGNSLQQSLANMSVDTTNDDSSLTETPPPYSPSQLSAPTPLQAHPQIPLNVGDDLRRKAILRSYWRSSQDPAPAPVEKEGGLETPVRRGSGTQIVGNLVNVLVNAILTDAKRSVSGHRVGNNGESSSTQVGARESGNENESTYKETRVLSGEVEIKSAGDQGECLTKEKTEVTGDKETSESKDKPEDDADSKIGKHRKRKEHSDSDDEFEQLPKRSHIEN